MFLFVKVCTFKEIVLSARKTLFPGNFIPTSCFLPFLFFWRLNQFSGSQTPLGQVLFSFRNICQSLVVVVAGSPNPQMAVFVQCSTNSRARSPSAPPHLHGGIINLPNSNNLVTVISAGNKQKQLHSSLSLSAWMHSLWKAFLARQKFRISNWNLGHVSRNDQTPMFRNNIIMQRMN